MLPDGSNLGGVHRRGVANAPGARNGQSLNSDLRVVNDPAALNRQVPDSLSNSQLAMLGAITLDCQTAVTMGEEGQG